MRPAGRAWEGAARPRSGRGDTTSRAYQEWAEALCKRHASPKGRAVMPFAVLIASTPFGRVRHRLGSSFCESPLPLRGVAVEDKAFRLVGRNQTRGK